MPWKITVNDSRCPASKPFSVVKEDDNALEGCHETRQSAADQIAALNAAEADKAKEDAPRYRPVATDAAQKCTNCKFNTRPQFCERFDFIFDPNHVCDAWETRRRQARGNSDMREHKNFASLGLKVIDADQGIVEHIITVFGVLDYTNDISHPGSFTKTLAERGQKTLVLDMHNYTSVMDVLGKPLQIAEIPREQLPPAVLNEFPEATGGVKATTQFFMDTPEGKGAFIRLKRDGIREWSYGYDALDVDFETVQDKGGNDVNARNLRTVKLYEYGPVLWGAVPGTATLSAKGQEETPTQQVSEDDSIMSPQDKALTMPPENKAINLSGLVDKVMMAFYTQYPDQFEPPETRNVYWVRQVWDEFVVVSQKGVIANTLWKVNYAVSGEQFIFAQPSTWQEMQEVIVPVEPTSGIMSADDPEAKVGRAISSANGRRIATAIVALAELLESVGIDIPGFGRTENSQHEDEEEEKATIIKIDDGSRYIISYPQKLSMRDLHRISERLNEWIDNGDPFIVTEGGVKLTRVHSALEEKQVLGHRVIADFDNHLKMWGDPPHLSRDQVAEIRASLLKGYEIETVESAPTPDEQAAIENQPDGQPIEAGPDVEPPTPEDTLIDWITLETESLELIKLGGG